MEDSEHGAPSKDTENPQQEPGAASEAAEARADAESPAPAPTEPVAPAPTEPVAPAPAQPSALARFVVEPFWAGLAAGGSGIAILGFFEIADRSHLIRLRPKAFFVFLLFAAPLVIGLFRGYHAPLRGPSALFGRFLGVLVYGLLSAAAIAGCVMPVLEALDVQRMPSFFLLTLAGALAATIALVRVRVWSASRAHAWERGEPARAATSEQAPAPARAKHAGEWIGAGALGGGFALWLIATYALLLAADIIETRPFGGLLFVAIATSLLAALAMGFSTPLSSYRLLAARIAGVLVLGAAGMGVVLVVPTIALKVLGARDDTVFFVFALVAVAVAALALYRRYGKPRAGRPRAMALGALGLAVAFPLWPASPRLRCLCGVGEACGIVAQRFSFDGDDDGAMRYAERGCELDSPYSCRRAGIAYAFEVGDRARGEYLLRVACALEDNEACGLVHVVELDKRCDRNSPMACAELGQVYAQGEGVSPDRTSSLRYYRRACLLGDREACARSSPH